MAGRRRAISPSPDLLTVAQVAERLSVCVRTVRRMVKNGRLPPPLRFSSKLVRWRRRDVDDYLRGSKDLSA